MSGIPAGSIVHMGGRTVLNRLQDAGLQDPKVPTTTVYETGNDLVVGKILTEADFRFQLTSWDVSTDLMALFTGEYSALGESISGTDDVGSVYKWEDVGFINVASPWKDEVGTSGGAVSAGVIIPNLYPTGLTYRLGVTDNAQMQATLSTGSYYMDGHNYPLEEIAVGDGATTAYVTSESANVYRVGGSGGNIYYHVFGVQVAGQVMIPGVDFVESGGAAPEVDQTAVTITFTVAPVDGAVVRYMYFSTTSHSIPQADNLPASVTLPAAIRGRDIDILIGDPWDSPTALYGVQSIQLQASVQGQLQRQMGYQDPIGFANVGIDCSGTATIEPKDKDHLFSALALMLGVNETEIFGYINNYQFPLTFVINEPGTSTIIKSIYVPDALFQAPGESARVQQTTQFPITFESFSGTFREVKGALPTAET
jgi:hypothetical protein